MKHLKTSLTIILISFVLILNAGINPENIDHNKTADSMNAKISAYLNSINYDNEEARVTIFSDFLIKENGDFYSLDFMLIGKDKIVILSNELEDEFYKMDGYSSQIMGTHNLPLVIIKSAKSIKTKYHNT